MYSLEPLPLDRSDELWDFCARFPHECIHIAGWLTDGGLRRPGVGPFGRGWLFGESSRGGELRALALLNPMGILHPVGTSAGLLDGLTRLARTNPGLMRVLVGVRSCVDALWERLGGLGLRARALRSQQLMAVDRARFRPAPPAWSLSPASPADLDELVEASAAMAREESGEDPQARNPALFRERITSRVGRGRDFILRVDGALGFKCNVAALSSLGGQLEGIYTSPVERRRGYGRGGTSWVTDWVLQRGERAVLLVNDDNQGAQALYRSLGYHAVHPSRTVFLSQSL